jgi:hypothetical protein
MVKTCFRGLIIEKGVNMRKMPVISTNVRSIGYFKGVIEVEFNNGSVYHYFGANEYLFNQFLNAPSKGQFVHHVLRHYNYQRVA